jgi:predicted aspartyl protease
VSSRRAFLLRAAALGGAAGALWLVRDRLPWPPLEVRFTQGPATPWARLPARGGLIEIPVLADGVRIRAAVDSGAQFSAIDGALAERLGLARTIAAPLIAYGVSGGPNLTHTVKLGLQLPGLEIPHLKAAALPLADIAFATGRDFQLLIGRDVLSRVVLEADFPAGRVRFLAPGTFRPPRDAEVVPLKRRGGAPTATVHVEAAPPLDVLVDTGATAILALSEDAARATGLLAPGRPVTRAHSVSLGGLSLDRMVVARSIRLGGVTVRNAAVQVYSPGKSTPAPAGLLGSGLLGRFRMALDLPAEMLVLTPPALTIVRPQTVG